MTGTNTRPGVSASPPSADQSARGDYSKSRSDYTCDQEWLRYTEGDHDTYRRLYDRQVGQLPGLATDEFLAGLQYLGPPDRIPRFEEISERLKKVTGWEVVAVPGLIPDEAFVSLLADRRFPVTTWIRSPEELDYIVEPDVFHDLFGHVPHLSNPIFADYLQEYGKASLKLADRGVTDLLARCYWYTVEFGLVDTPRGTRAYGAGLMSSPSELPYSLFSSEPVRLRFDLERVMRTRYKIDTHQATYFVIQSLHQLLELSIPRLVAACEPVRQRVALDGEVDPGKLLPGERRKGDLDDQGSDRFDPPTGFVPGYDAAVTAGALYRERTIHQVDMLSPQDAARRLNVNLKELEQMHSSGQLLALRADDGESCYPDWQLEPAVQTALPHVLAQLGPNADSWASYLFLTQQSPLLSSKTPLQELRSKNLRGVLCAAAALRDELA